MIEYFEGTVFNTNADAIVNTINCDGFMGAGLALEFSLRYPNMLKDYEYKCKNNIIKIGKVDTFKEKDVLIVNFPTKNSFKFPSQIKWIEEGLQDFVANYKTYNIKSIAFPKLGCSNGGLDWSIVKNLMIKYLSNTEITVYICEDVIKEAQGKEKEMLEIFNKTDLFELAHNIKLSSKQIEALEKDRPYSRFWMISKTPSIGKTGYKNIFKYFYNIPSQQMKLF